MSTLDQLDQSSSSKPEITSNKRRKKRFELGPTSTTQQPIQCMLGSNDWCLSDTELPALIASIESQNNTQISTLFEPTSVQASMQEDVLHLDEVDMQTISNQEDGIPLCSIDDNFTNEPTNEAANILHSPSCEASNVTTQAQEPQQPQQAQQAQRPIRASKRRALQLIRGIHAWENCAESSVMFQRVAQHLDEEMQNEVLQGEEKEALQGTGIEAATPINNNRRERQNQHYNDHNNDTYEQDEISTSEDESMTESMKDFIVSDEEEVDSEASFQCNEDDGDEDEEEEEEEEEEEDEEVEEKQDEDSCASADTILYDNHSLPN